MLEALAGRGFTVKLSKCSFRCRYLEYLGHCIGDGQIAVPAHRLQALVEFRQPSTKRDLRSFLGAVSYYRRFLPGLASHSAVLTPSTTKSAPGVVSGDDRHFPLHHPSHFRDR